MSSHQHPLVPTWPHIAFVVVMLGAILLALAGCASPTAPTAQLHPRAPLPVWWIPATLGRLP